MEGREFQPAGGNSYDYPYRESATGKTLRVSLHKGCLLLTAMGTLLQNIERCRDAVQVKPCIENGTSGSAQRSVAEHEAVVAHYAFIRAERLSCGQTVGSCPLHTQDYRGNLSFSYALGHWFAMDLPALPNTDQDPD